MESEIQTIISEAEALVNGARQEDYGTPEQNMEDIAAAWSAIFGRRRPISGAEVALCMAALKRVRQQNKPKRDNLVDEMGYMIIAGRCARAASESEKCQK